MAANSRSTGAQQQNTDDHNCPVDTPERPQLPLTSGPQMLTTDNVGCLCATFRHVQRSCSVKSSVHQHGELEL